MSLIFLYSCLIIIFTAPYSLVLYNQKKINTYSYSKNIIFGIIVISFIAILINFFFPLNIYICSIIPLVSILIIFKYKKKFFNINFLKIILIQGIVLTLLLTESNVYRPDAGLYHLPYIGILNSEKIIFGLSNLHTRYAHTSIIQYYAAINNNFIFQNNGIVFSQALVASSIIINFLTQINLYIKKKNFNFHFFFLFFIFIFIIYKMNRYSEYGNDAPAHFLVFFLISEILRINHNFNVKNYANNLILSLFIVQSKLTLIFIVMINLININKIKLIDLTLDRRFIFTTFFLVIWLTKNMILSGCLLYPIKSTCFDKFSWTNLERVDKVSIESEAWTKGWSNKNPTNKISQNDFIKKFNWVDSWTKVHFVFILKKLTPYIVFCCLIFLILKINSENKKILNFQKEYFYYFIILLICFIIWYLKSPLFRYGYSYLICIIAFSFSFFCSKIEIINNKKYSLNIILVVCIIIFLGKNLIRIIDSENNYNNYPWPKYYSMDNQNILTNFNYITLNNLDIIIPLNGYCMYVKKVCSHYSITEPLKVKKKYNFYIMDFK